MTASRLFKVITLNLLVIELNIKVQQHKRHSFPYVTQFH